MIDSLDGLRTVFVDTPLEGREIVELPVLDTGEIAFALDVDVSTLEPSWRAARARLDETGRWPIVSTCWSHGGGSFAEWVREEDLFSRFYFEEAPDAGDVSPRALIERSRTSDVDTFLAALDRERREEEDVAEILDLELEETGRVVGSAPARAELERAALESPHRLDRWLLDWELAHGGLGDPAEARFEGFTPDRALLLLLPTADGWESLAYVNWYGTQLHGAQHFIALGRSWQERFGAELFAHYGTMLECRVSRPPADPRSAWEVAREHDLAAPSTLALPGAPLRRYANALAGHDHWFLHERP